MEGSIKVKRPPHKIVTMKKCPKCDGTDLLVLPGSPTYYSCQNKECLSHKKPPDSKLYNDSN